MTLILSPEPMATNVRFLQAFSGKSPTNTRDAVWSLWKQKKFKHYLWLTSIDEAIQVYRDDGGFQQESPVAELRQLFQKTDTLYSHAKRWELFNLVLNDLQKGKADSTENIIAIALSEAFPEECFKRIFENGRQKGASPFVKASSIGASDLVGKMLQKYRETSTTDPENTPIEVLTNIQEALKQATTESHLAVIEKILAHDSRFASQDRVNQIITQNADRPSPFLQGCNGHAIGPRSPSELARREADEQSLKVLCAFMAANSRLAGRETFQKAVYPGSQLIFGYLLRADREGGATYVQMPLSFRQHIESEEAGQYVLQRGKEAVWQIYCEEILVSRNNWADGPDKHEESVENQGSQLLHQAIKHRKVYAVKWLLEHCPKLSVYKTQGSYPLEILTAHVPNCEARKIMRDILVPSVIRNAEMYTVRTILNTSKVEVNEISLPLSQFNTRDFSFADYVFGLTSSAVQPSDRHHLRCLNFEKVLKSVDFPDLNVRFPAGIQDEMRTDNSEIETVLDWLRRKGVEEIMNINVPDRLYSSHTDLTIRNCVCGFKVENLNWRKMNLYLDNYDADWKPTEQPVWAKSLKKLSLFSDGTPAVHDHWISRLPKLRAQGLQAVEVYVVEDTMSSRRANEVHRELRKRFRTICDPIKLDYTISKQRWSISDEQVEQRKLGEINSSAVGPKVANFIAKFNNAHKEITSLHSAKVAVIDSGVVGVRHSIEDPNPSNQLPVIHGSDFADRIVAGRSFVYDRDGEEVPWYLASDPHGTQMTRLICAINPCCEVYVARVGENSKSAMSASSIEKAIDWAVDRGVDIISMSLATTDDENRVIRKALERATDKDIAVFCSTADEGNNSGSAYPADYDTNSENALSRIFGVFAVTACDGRGKPLNISKEKGYSYRLVGKDVLVGAVPFLRSQEIVSGSSVATAIAAGLASLVLSCRRIVHKNEAMLDRELSRRQEIIRRFELMKNEKLEESAKYPLYVRPFKLCGAKMQDDFQFEEVLIRAFGDKPSRDLWT
ncbi:hypothetical protein BDV95DRAFT_574246 [Massariosphaeria phaeospora]|uniref:Peptidase S8/S53 domain-containing protein n=1 Tax=Massariosphaeria phaeospora TaxID=100035 RepID=A0A7C8I4F1_9PLEO|nr:hypothetical protein BDV95DRAFT_574246 [Massariosphaeria phaeospora]